MKWAKYQAVFVCSILLHGLATAKEAAAAQTTNHHFRPDSNQQGINHIRHVVDPWQKKTREV
jgi:hypothetical protein